MLHLRLRVPDDLVDKVVPSLTQDPTVANVLKINHAYVDPPGALVMADVARENANSVFRMLREHGLQDSGAITISESEIVMSEAAREAEVAAPGTPIDAVVWDLIEDRTRDEVRLSFAFVAFLTLATLIAAIGRVLDETVLIVGAMVVGPEFSAIAAVCFALARPRLSLIRPAVTTFFAGVAIALAIAVALSIFANLVGAISTEQVAHGPETDFIVKPDAWSFVIALLAGVAGTLSLTTSKSSTLVGVFISVTTVPALGTLALAIATAQWTEARSSIVQLALNIVGLVLAGTATLLAQKLYWQRIVPSRRRTAPAPVQ